MTEDLKNMAWLIVIFVVAMVFLGWAVWIGVNRHERYECAKWRNEAEFYRPLYYITEWQAKQCDAHGIEIGAPVIKTNLQWKKR